MAEKKQKLLHLKYTDADPINFSAKVARKAASPSPRNYGFTTERLSPRTNNNINFSSKINYQRKSPEPQFKRSLKMIDYCLCS